ncbi:27132_t:CDS:1, partial [Racocetra persica]
YNKGNTNSTRHWRQNELTTPNCKTMKTKSMQIMTYSTKHNQDLPTEIYNAEIDDAEINGTKDNSTKQTCLPNPNDMLKALNEKNQC